jgi:hypothetical protein
LLLGVVDKGGLIAVGEFGAAKAVSPDLAWQFHLIYVSKFLPSEEFWLVGKTKDGGDAKLRRFLEAGGYQLVAKTLSLAVFSHGYRPYLGKV